MPVLNQPNLEALDEELRLARQRGVGVMAMKSMKGLKGLDSQVAYLKKILSNPAVTTVTKGIGSFDMFEAYLQALNEPLTSAEDRALYRYAQVNRSNNCMLCDDMQAEPVPLGVEVSTVLRCKDYYYEQMKDSLYRAPHLSRYSAREGWQRRLPLLQEVRVGVPRWDSDRRAAHGSARAVFENGLTGWAGFLGRSNVGGAERRSAVGLLERRSPLRHRRREKVVSEDAKPAIYLLLILALPGLLIGQEEGVRFRARGDSCRRQGEACAAVAGAFRSWGFTVRRAEVLQLRPLRIHRWRGRCLPGLRLGGDGSPGIQGLEHRHHTRHLQHGSAVERLWDLFRGKLAGLPVPADRFGRLRHE